MDFDGVGGRRCRAEQSQDDRVFLALDGIECTVRYGPLRGGDMVAGGAGWRVFSAGDRRMALMADSEKTGSIIDATNLQKNKRIWTD